jgi:hypothetical protein
LGDVGLPRRCIDVSLHCRQRFQMARLYARLQSRSEFAVVSNRKFTFEDSIRLVCQVTMPTTTLLPGVSILAVPVGRDGPKSSSVRVPNGHPQTPFQITGEERPLGVASAIEPRAPSRYRPNLRPEYLGLRLACSEIVEGQGRCPWSVL